MSKMPRKRQNSPPQNHKTNPHVLLRWHIKNRQNRNKRQHKKRNQRICRRLLWQIFRPIPQKQTIFKKHNQSINSNLCFFFVSHYHCSPFLVPKVTRKKFWTKQFQNLNIYVKNNIWQTIVFVLEYKSLKKGGLSWIIIKPV